MAVYLDRVRIGAAVPQALLVVEALDEHLHDLAVTRGVIVVEHAGLKLLDDETAVLLGLGVDLVGHFGGLRALLGRILEHADALDGDILEELAQLSEFLVGLAGQADDQARAQHETRDAAAHILDELCERRAVARTVHRAQDALRNVLERNIEVFYDLRLLSDDVDELVGDLVGVEVVQADPCEIQLAQLAQQLGQQALVLRQVHAVLGDVLRDDDELLDACVRERTRLLEQRRHLTAAVASAQLGDDAVGAGVRAALRDLEVRGVGGGQTAAAAVERRRSHVRHVSGLFAAKRRSRGVHNVVIAAGAAEYVDLRQLPAHFVRVALHETAGDDQTLHAAGLLVLRGLEDGLDGFGLCRFDEAAGVDHADVRLAHILRDLPARVSHQGEHMLAVHQIFGAAERNKS